MAATWELAVGPEPWLWLEVVDVDIDREAQSHLPGQAHDAVGTTIAGGKVVVAGAPSPWSERLEGRAVELRRNGEAILKASVLRAHGAAADGTVELQLADAASRLASFDPDISVPVISKGADGVQPGMHSQWVVSDLLGVSGLGPHGHLRSDPSTAMHAPLAGSMMPTKPRLGTVPNSGRIFLGSPNEQPTFKVAPWGLALDEGFISGALPTGTDLQGGTIVRVVMAVDWDDQHDEGVGGVTMPIGVKAGNVEEQLDATLSHAFGGHAANGQWVPTNEYGRVGYHAHDLRVDETTGELLLDMWWRGVKYATGIVWPDTAGLDMRGGVIEFFSMFGDLRVGGWTVQFDPAGDPPVEPRGSLGSFGLPLDISLLHSEPTPRWDIIQQAAAASGSMLWIDADGRAQAVGPDDLALAQPTATLDPDVVAALEWDTSTDAFKRWLEVPYTPVSSQPADVVKTVMVWVTAKTQRHTGTRWEHPAQIRTWTHPGVIYDSKDPATGNVLGTGSWKASQTSATFARLEVTSTAAQSGWMEVVLTTVPWAPVEWVVGDDDVLVVDTQADKGGTWTHPTSQHLQTDEAARALANRIAPDLRTPAPEVSGVELASLGDLDVGDIVELVEPLWTGVYWRRAIVVSSGWTGLAGRQLALRALRDTWQAFEEEHEGNVERWSDLEAAWSGQTWNDLEANPLAAVN